jgi:two-component system alkaline phosphatase synthesis response regulator PhoP
MLNFLEVDKLSRILLVDDEKNIVDLIKFNLIKERWDVDVAFDGLTAIDLAVKNRPDIIILDIMLPGVDGLDVCRILRSKPETESIPIIMVSAKAEELDKVLGLEMGADDYLTKPFSPRELMARIKAHLRRKEDGNRRNKDEAGELKAGNITIDTERYDVLINGAKHNLTFKEFELLKFLVTNKGKVFTREHLLNRIWNYEDTRDTRTIDVHIRHLRQKIEKDPASPIYIETIRGVGYRFNDIKT